MTIFHIEELKVTTVGGYHGEITGIQNGHDLLVGWVETPDAGKINISWNASGAAHNAPEACNISVHERSIEELIGDAKTVSRRMKS